MYVPNRCLFWHMWPFFFFPSLLFDFCVDPTKKVKADIHFVISSHLIHILLITICFIWDDFLKNIFFTISSFLSFFSYQFILIILIANFFSLVIFLDWFPFLSYFILQHVICWKLSFLIKPRSTISWAASLEY